MGTEVTLVLPEPWAAAGATAVRALFERWEGVLSRFRPDSELSRANARAGETVPVGRLFGRVLGVALAAARDTGGLYDPTLLTQIAALGYDRSFALVPPEGPGGAPAGPGGRWREVALDERAGRVRVPEGAGLDLGGIAKGMAVDAAVARLAELGIAPALVSGGGDLAVTGAPSPGGYWPIGLPEAGGAAPALLRRGALATSSRSRRAWRRGGEARHHILDPRTGRPVRNGLRAVSVAADRCAQAEVAAKAALILGPSAGPRFLAGKGLAGLLVDDAGSRRDRRLAPEPSRGGAVSGWGPVTWDLARAGGLVAFGLLTVSVAAGLLLSLRAASPRWPRLLTNELHGFLSMTALVFVILHVAAVWLDPFTGFGLAEILVPLASHYRPLWMALGIVALDLILAVWLSTKLRGRIGYARWRSLHYVTFAIYAAALVHGLGTG